MIQAHIAQSVEHFLGKEEVTGSNPVMSSIFRVGASASAFVLFLMFLNNRAARLRGSSYDGKGKV